MISLPTKPSLLSSSLHTRYKNDLRFPSIIQRSSHRETKPDTIMAHAISTTGTAATQSPPKRRSSTANLGNNGRTVKRRASKACHCCRARKVRCDVIESGTPCTNCRLDQVECVVSHSKRRKKSPGDDDLLNHSPISSNEEMEDMATFPNFEDDAAAHELQPGLNEIVGISGSHSTEADFNHHVPHMLCKLLALNKKRNSKLI